MTREEWKVAITKLKPGLSLQEACTKLRQPYSAGRKWLISFGYEYADGRKAMGQLKRMKALRQFAKADWTQSNIVLARKYNVTREWIRQVRESLGLKKVEARGRKKNGV